eukprot:2585225-Rhodomonas_salina.1
MTPLPKGLAESQGASPTGSSTSKAVRDASNCDPATALPVEATLPSLGAIASPADGKRLSEVYKPVSGEDIVLAI